MPSSLKVLEKIGDTVIISMNLADFDEMKGGGYGDDEKSTITQG
jgi:hypothetical protein